MEDAAAAAVARPALFVALLAGLASASVAEPSARAEAAPAPAKAEIGAACETDAQCPEHTICQDRICQAFERPLKILLFRKEGPKTAFLPFYWSRRGNPGYRVVAPFYFHFWAPDARSRVVAPFYFHFEDYVRQKFATVIFAGLPISWTREPGASSWAVWPFVYKSTRFGWAAPLLGSFRIDNPKERRSYGLAALLYYWSRNEATRAATDVLFPVFYAHREPGHAFTWALPLNFYWRTGKEKHLVAFPLAYYRSDPKSGLLVTPLGYSSTAGHARTGALAWLYWYGRKGDGNGYDVFFPLLWSFRSPERSTTVAANVLSLRRPDWSFRTFFPLYFGGTDRKTDGHWNLLVPFAYWSRQDGDRRSRWLTPLGGGARDDQAGTHSVTMWLPPIITRRDAQGSFAMITPLYFRSRDFKTGSDTLLAGPFFRQTDSHGATTTLFPLFWRFRDQDAGATATLALPFFFHRSNPTDRLTAAGVFPLWFYARDRGAAGGSAGLFPIAFFGRHNDARHAVVFPVFWHFSDARSRFTFVPPLFYSAWSLDGHHRGIPPLLFFQGGDSDGSYAIQFPLFWRFADRRTASTTTVIGPAFLTQRPRGWSGGLFPLLFAGRNEGRRHTVVFPLFWRFRDDRQDRATTLVANYLHARHGGERTDAVLPLFYYRRGSRPGGSDETTFTLFPLAHYARDARRTLLVSPLAAWSRTAERSMGAVLPYFWYRSREVSARGVPPLWFDVTNLARRERTRFFGPFIATDTPTAHARFLFPLVARYWTEDETGTYVFPTYFRRRVAGRYALDTLFPLFWSSSSPTHRTLQIGPFWTRRTPTTVSTGFVPFYLYARNPERSLLLTPLGYHREDLRAHTSSTSFALLFYRSTDPDGHRTVLFPLWFSGRNGPRSHQLLFPLFWHAQDEAEHTSFTILGPLFAARSGATRTRGIFPVTWYSRNDQGGGSTALLPLFYERHDRLSQSLFTPLFGFGHHPDRSWWYVPPVHRYETGSSSYTALYPLFFNHVDKATDTHTRFVLPLLHYARESPEKSLSFWLALFWRHRDIGSATTVLFPLFWDHNAHYESRTTLLFPLFLRHYRHADDTAYSFVAPLFYRRSAPNSSTTVLFPLFWDFKSEARRTTLLFPLFGNFVRARFTATYVFPNVYYRRANDPTDDTFRFLVFPLWESEAKRQGDYSWEVLLGLFGYERIGRNRFLKLLFIPFELDPLPRAQTAWYGGRSDEHPRVARNRPARGFAGHIW